MSGKGKKANTPPTEPITPGDVTPPGDNEGDGEEVARLREQIAALSTRIEEIESGEEAWRATTITSLQQELADLKATLQTVTENQPLALTELREELTRLRQEIAALKATPPEPEAEPEVLDPPDQPPVHPEIKADGLKGNHAESEPINPPSNKSQRKKIVL